MNPSKFLPPSWSAVLDRERLLVRLGAWESRKLLLIHGPAGQGKSTLAAAYVRGLAAPSVWYTLDDNDNDPVVLLAGLVHAVERAHPRAAGSFPALPRPPYGAASPSAALRTWRENICKALPDGLIVFDDYPADDATSSVREILTSLLSSPVPGLRIMIISRSRPSLDVSGLRAKRQVGEIDGRELRFSDAEAAALFASVFGTPVPAVEAASLNRLTEGWAAGLVLMHEYLSSLPAALRAKAFRGRGAETFRGQVFDYLAHGVFSNLSPEIRDFLLRTSVADHLPTPLMAVLSGLPPDGAAHAHTVTAVVRELQRRNLFVSDLDEGTAIRYHALFRDFLRRQASELLAPSEVKRLHLAAAGYFAKHGDTVRSLDLLLASGQAEKGLALLERSGSVLIAAGQITTLLRLIDRLPPPLAERPWPVFYRAVACRFSDASAALRLFEQAHAGFMAAGAAEGEALSLSGIIEAAFHCGGDFRRMERAAGRAKAVLRSRRRVSRLARARLLLALGTASFFTGRLEEGIDALREAIVLFRALGDRFHQIAAAIYLAPCALYHGDFRLARETVRQGFEAQRELPDEPGGEAALHLVQAMTDLFDGDFPAAQASVDVCRRLVKEHGLESLDLLMLVIGGWVRLAQGDHGGAELLLEECRERGETAQGAFFAFTASHILAIVHLFQDSLAKAKVESDRALSTQPSGGSRLFRGIYLIVSGAVYLELGRSGRAAKDLRESLELLRQSKAGQQEANAHLMLARLCRRTGDAEGCRRHLRLGFSIGQARGITYFAPFTPGQLRELAQAAIENDVCADYCRSLLGRLLGVSVPPLRIFCLGTFRVDRNGVPVRDSEWKSRRSRSLIKLLAAGARERLSRDAAIDALWPDGQAAGRAALFAGLLHRARRTIDPPGRSGRRDSCIIQEGEQLFLNSELVWTDVEAFQTAIDRARAARRAGKEQEALTAYEQAVELYGGDLLPADLYDEWMAPHRRHLRTLFTEAIDHAAEAREALGDGTKPRVLYERMFDFDPCHDKACRWLMQRHAAEGERNRAIRVYERHELAVRKELDMEPDEKTRRLYRSIIGG